MQLTYNQKNNYNIICDSKGYCLACYINTCTEIFGDKVYLASSSFTEEISFDKMKKIIEELKKE